MNSGSVNATTGPLPRSRLSRSSPPPSPVANASTNTPMMSYPSRRAASAPVNAKKNTAPALNATGKWSSCGFMVSLGDRHNDRSPHRQQHVGNGIGHREAQHRRHAVRLFVHRGQRRRHRLPAAQRAEQDHRMQLANEAPEIERYD